MTKKPKKGQVWKQTHRKMGGRLKPVTKPYKFLTRGNVDIPLIYVVVTRTNRGIVYYDDYIPGEPKPTKGDYRADVEDFLQTFMPAPQAESLESLLAGLRVLKDASVVRFETKKRG